MKPEYKKRKIEHYGNLNLKRTQLLSNFTFFLTMVTYICVLLPFSFLPYPFPLVWALFHTQDKWEVKIFHNCIKIWCLKNERNYAFLSVVLFLVSYLQFSGSVGHNCLKSFGSVEEVEGDRVENYHLDQRILKLLLIQVNDDFFRLVEVSDRLCFDWFHIL